MSTTFASIDTPTSGVGTATALSTIGPATFMLSGPAPASSVYVLEVSIDGTTFEPLARLSPGAPLTLESAPFVSCRMRVLAGVAGVGAVVGYTDIISGRQAVNSVTLPVNGAAQSISTDQTSGKILVVSGPFDGTVTLEGASSNGVFVPIKQFTFTKLSAFDTSAFLFKVVVQQLRVSLTGSGNPTITAGVATDTGAASGGGAYQFLGRRAENTDLLQVWLNTPIEAAVGVRCYYRVVKSETNGANLEVEVRNNTDDTEVEFPVPNSGNAGTYVGSFSIASLAWDNGDLLLAQTAAGGGQPQQMDVTMGLVFEAPSS